jgi:pimeloyl-ACP methyl ester carboxylesterase
LPKTPINGFEMYYEDRGSGAPVVYVHGGFASLDTFLRGLTALTWTWENDFAAQFHFITYNRRGCHLSSCPEAGYDLVNQTLDLALLLDHLHIPSAHIIGSSAGGPIAIAFAAHHPTRTRSLVLAGTGLNLLRPDDPVAGIIQEQFLLLEQKGADFAFDHRPPQVQVSFKVLWEPEEMAARGTLSEYWNQQRVLEQQAAQLPREERVRHYVAELANMQAYVTGEESAYARQVAAPTLVLHGSDDRTVPVAWGMELAQIIPGAELHIVREGSHGLVVRDAVARRKVIEWIGDVA